MSHHYIKSDNPKVQAHIERVARRDHANEREERLLNSSAYIEKISRAIAEGIISYHRTIVYSNAR